MTVYVVALINIHDQSKYEPYMAGFPDIWKQFNGQILASDDGPRVIEGEWPFHRTVILSFPDEGAYDAWNQSPEYQELSKHRRSASTTSVVLLKSAKIPESLLTK